MVDLCRTSRLLFDQALYELRQHYFKFNSILNKFALVKLFRNNKNQFFYKHPTRIGKETLLTTYEAFNSSIELIKLYNTGELKHKPKLTKYLSRKNIDLFQTTFNKEAVLGINKKQFKQLSKDPNYDKLINDYNKNKDKLDIVRLSGTNIYFLLDKSIRASLAEIVIIPKNNYFLIKFVYKKPINQTILDYMEVDVDKLINNINQFNLTNVEIQNDEKAKPIENHVIKNKNKNKDKDKDKDNVDDYILLNNYCGIDLGVNNLMTLVFSTGHNPVIIDGGDVKSFNQFYNKELRRLKKIAKKCNGLDTTKRIQELTDKRNNKIDTLFHEITTNVVNYLVSINIQLVIVGKNDGWKQNTKGKLMKKVNQMFQHIPYNKLINQLTYKLSEYGIKLKKTEESYTSKCSFIDGEAMCKHNKYKGKRIKRGLFRTSTGLYINADVNGAYNIIRKVIPMFGWSEALSVKPIKYKLNHNISLLNYINNIKDIEGINLSLSIQ